MSTIGTGWLIRENKNYTEVAKNLLRSKFEGHTFQKDDLTFHFTRLAKLTGEAQINIRKGKQIVVYEYELECQFRAESEVDECEGNFRVVEINESDLDFEITSINITKEGKIGTKARQILKNCLRNEIIVLIKDLTSELMAFENDPAKLEADRKKREENDAKFKQIVAEKGAEKEKLLEEQRLADLKMKEKSQNN